MPPHFHGGHGHGHGGSDGADKITRTGMEVLLAFVWQYRWRFALGIVGLMVIDATVLMMPKIIGFVFNALADGSATREYIARWSLYMVLIMCFGIFFRFLWRYCFFGVGIRINRDLKQRVYDHLSHMPPQYFDQNRVGDLTAHMTNDVFAVEHSVSFGMLAACDALVLGGGTIALMFQANPRLALLVLLPVPLIMVVVRCIGRYIRRLFFNVQAAFSAMTERAQEIFAGIMVVKAYGDEPASSAAFAREGREYVDHNIRLASKSAVMGPFIMAVSSLSTALLLYFGGVRIILGDMQIGVFTQFVMYLGTITWPMIAISEVINHLERGCASAERIKKILDTDSPIKDGPEEAGEGLLLEARDLTYAYPGATGPALRNVSCHVREGETLGIVGRTGSGKTTLADLFMRLYEPPAGTVLLNGKDIASYGLESLRGCFGYVPQEPFLFNMTIRDNIRFGRPEMSDEEVEFWARQSHIHEEILKFKEGYETWVGERGVTLSGGQKQRVAIARALSLRPRVLVLDDALSAVDAETEADILRSLKELRKGATNIIIAHRLSAVREATRILVLNDGALEATGVHDELKKTSPYYQELYMLQSAIVPEADSHAQ